MPVLNDSASSSPTEPLALAGSVWLQAGAQTLGGAARIALLAAIHETGSITGAAKAVGMSYKAAWDAIDAMNNLAGEALVKRASGGKGGGGTTLTARALKLIETFRAIEREHRRFLDAAGAAIDGFAGDWAMLARIGLRTSARNAFYGTIDAIVRGAVNDEITLVLRGGQRIVAVVTCESTETLALAVGQPVCALVKASAVLIVADAQTSARLSARNQLHGVVRTIKRGAVNAEVTLELDGGIVVTATVSDDGVEAPGLAEGQPATAVFKASSVILAVGA